MSTLLKLQQWQAAHQLDDTIMGEAYETLSGQERAVLKKSIARLYDIWGEPPLRVHHTKLYRQGFSLELDEGPVPHALFVCDSGYGSPSSFLAAIMPALLAGVFILPCFVTDKTPKPGNALLGALELAGVEHVYAAGKQAILELAQVLDAKSGRGRIVLLGDPELTVELAHFAHSTGTLCRSLTSPPWYYSPSRCEVVEQRFGLAPASPDGLSVEPDVSDCPYSKEDMFLHLDAEHEDIWVWPGLGPDWFRSKRMRLFS